MPRDLYNFTKVREARSSLGDKVNVIGVVLECGFPRDTKGTDYYIPLRIIDETHQSPGLLVHVFTKTMDKLPCILSAGDIFQINQAMMKLFDGEPCAVFNKKFSTYALYEGRDGRNLIPYQIYEGFRERDLDKNFVVDLRKWLRNFQLNEGSNNFSLVKEIRPGEGFNLFCQIVHVHEVGSEWMAFVWDGTDAPPASIPQKLEEEMDHPLPLQLESLPLSRDALCSFPAVGTVLRVASHEIEKDNLHPLKVGKWVKLVNLQCEVHAGLWRCVLTAFTRLRYTSNEERLILERQRLYDERLLQSPISLRRMPLPSSPQSSHITEVDDDHAPFHTLMDVLTSSEGTGSFRCIVRVVAAFPCQAKDFRFPVGMVGRIRFTLEDSTARIHAFLYADDGMKFFDGHSSVEVLTRKRNALLGVATNNYGEEIDDIPRNPPWVHFCLKFDFLDEKDKWGSRHYRISGTKLVA